MTVAGPRRIRMPGEPLREGATALRPWRETDAPALVELCADPEIARWTRIPTPFSAFDARTFLLTRQDLSQAGAAAPFAIVEAGTGTLLGSISLVHLAWEHRRGEIGYWLGPEARGHGHATRAVRLACAWGFRTLDLERIELVAAIGNPASQAVARRAGFTAEAVLRSYLHDGQDMVCFGLLARAGEPGDAGAQH